MKKTILSISAAILMSLAAVSCASHHSVRTTTYTQGEYETQGEWQKCAVCDGKGSCTACRGTGRISGDTCKRCKGSGKCNTCNGNGGYTIN
ncbi:MAG: hypothetical protein IKH01_07130 [Prevotella sp.]|nr:hypothetical protein [Prevotella sp.]MBR3079570.1 hypothetical protein [Prevotella sp.]